MLSCAKCGIFLHTNRKAKSVSLLQFREVPFPPYVTMTRTQFFTRYLLIKEVFRPISKDARILKIIDI